MGKTIKIPPSFRTENARQAGVKPPVILPEDRLEFLRDIEPEFQVSAEAHWNNIVDANEDQHRWERQKDDRTVTSKRVPYFLTVEQVASRWNLSARTVWRMVKERRIPSRLIGSSRRILEEDVENFEMKDLAVA